jgi:hypothetical protein
VGGWGRRATLAALYGCVPVLIQDDTADALDELLDWSTFSVRIAEKDVDRLPALLAAVSPARLAGMQRELACAWPRANPAASRAGAEDESTLFHPSCFATNSTRRKGQSGLSKKSVFRASRS